MDHILLRCVRFVVQPAGHARAIREGRRNVHAFARGYWCAGEYPPATYGPPVRLTYNPFRGSSFTRVDTGEPVEAAHWAVVKGDGTILAYDLGPERG